MKTIYFIYHSIGGNSLDDSLGLFSRSPSAFEDDCQFISEFNSAEKDRQIIITFDDGYKDNLPAAELAQDKYNLQSILFVCTQYLDQPGFLSTLSLDSVLSRSKSKIKLGFHGQDHTPFDLLSSSALNSQCADWFRLVGDLQLFKGEHQKMRVSLPHGRYTKQVIMALREQGFKTIFTSDGGWNVETSSRDIQHRPLIRRNCVTRDLSTDYLAFMTKSRYHYIECAKAALRQIRREI